MRELLSSQEAEYIIKVFNIDQGGNFSEETGEERTGRNILYLKNSLPEITSELKIPEERLRMALNLSRQKPFTRRKERVPPHKDDKILTDWNGLMIAALS